MAYYLVNHGNKWHVNEELYVDAVAKGERAFMRLLAKKDAEGVPLLDQVLYPVTPEQEEACGSFVLRRQDFDDACRHINVISRDTIRKIRRGTDNAFPGALVIVVEPDELHTCNRIRFLRARDFNNSSKYRMMPKLASVRVCGSLYVAVNAVDIRVEKPIIVTVDE